MNPLSLLIIFDAFNDIIFYTTNNVDLLNVLMTFLAQYPRENVFIHCSSSFKHFCLVFSKRFNKLKKGRLSYMHSDGVL